MLSQSITLLDGMSRSGIGGKIGILHHAYAFTNGSSMLIQCLPCQAVLNGGFATLMQ